VCCGLRTWCTIRPQSISPTTAIRLPWMEALYKPWFSLWMPLIGFDPLLAVAFDAFAATVSLTQHTDRQRGRRTRTTVLDKVVVTAATHRVHHGSNAEYIDRNFGAVFVVWDRMFGTYEPEVAPVVYGIGAKQLNTPADVLVGGYDEIAAALRTDATTADKLRFVVDRPGSALPRSGEITRSAALERLR
jgi:sterol desaturase/sphingolipid hydroxylase (fatty acid hydroxylase superfamily)